MIFTCCSAIYLAAWFLQYENNILIFVANVFAPAALIVFVAAAAVADVFARIAGRRPSSNEILVRYSMIVSVLIPTVMGEVRSGGFASHRAAASIGKHLSVLDANVLGTVELEEGFYEALERLSPDIVLLQELNLPVAQKILERVGSRYSCQALQPQVGTYGMGVLAKFPCTPTPGPQELGGFGLPQFIDLQLDTHQQVQVINFHTIPPHTLIRNREQDNELQRLSNSIIEREKFMRSIVLQARKLPTDGIILGGDLNATVRNRVYGIIRELGLSDSWSVGDRLFGGTWPGPHYPLPSWLIRIDYIFYDGAWQAQKAWVGTIAGSDHRYVMADLVLL